MPSPRPAIGSVVVFLEQREHSEQLRLSATVIGLHDGSVELLVAPGPHEYLPAHPNHLALPTAPYKVEGVPFGRGARQWAWPGKP